MPDRDADEPHSARLLTGLLWGGVGLAPVAVLLVLLGDGGGSLRFAMVLLAVCVVLIGAALLIRNDPVLSRWDVQDRVAGELDALRDELRAEFAAAGPRPVRPMTPPPMSAPPGVAQPMTPPPMAPPPMSPPPMSPPPMSPPPMPAKPVAAAAVPPAASAAVPAGPAAAPAPRRAGTAAVPRPAAATAQVPRPATASAQVPRPGVASAAVPHQRGAAPVTPARAAAAVRPPDDGVPARAAAAVRPPDEDDPAGVAAAAPVHYPAPPPPDDDAPVRSRRRRRAAVRPAAEPDDPRLDPSPSAWLAEPDDQWAAPAYDEQPARRHRAGDDHDQPDAYPPQGHYDVVAAEVYPAEPDYYPDAEPDLYVAAEHDGYPAVEPEHYADAPPPRSARHGSAPVRSYPQDDEYGRW